MVPFRSSTAQRSEPVSRHARLVASPKVPGELEIHGPTLVLRYPTGEDAQQLFELGSDPAMARYLSWAPYTEVSQAERFIEGTAADRESGKELGFVVTRDGEVLGFTVFTDARPRDCSVTIGTWLGADHWGTGVNTELKALMAALAFRAMGVERLSVYAAASNERSRAALRKVGFTEEGVLRRFNRHGDEWFDCAIGSILRDEFEDGPLSGTRAEIIGEVPANWSFSG